MKKILLQDKTLFGQKVWQITILLTCVRQKAKFLLYTRETNISLNLDSPDASILEKIFSNLQAVAKKNPKQNQKPKYCILFWEFHLN